MGLLLVLGVKSAAFASPPFAMALISPLPPVCLSPIPSSSCWGAGKPYTLQGESRAAALASPPPFL